MERDQTSTAKGVRAAFDFPVLQVGALSGAGLALVGLTPGAFLERAGGRSVAAAR